jgi:hypothetical protein
VAHTNHGQSRLIILQSLNGKQKRSHETLGATYQAMNLTTPMNMVVHQFYCHTTTDRFSLKRGSRRMFCAFMNLSSEVSCTCKPRVGDPLLAAPCRLVAQLQLSPSSSRRACHCSIKAPIIANVSFKKQLNFFFKIDCHKEYWKLG